MSLESRQRFVYGGVTLYARPFACRSTTPTISYSLLDRQIQLNDPTTPTTQRLPAITRDRFGLFRFRSPLLTESRLLSLPVGNEMFHFPTFPPHALCVQAWLIRRFQHIETMAQAQCKLLHDMTLAEMDALWNNAKELE